MVTVGDPFNEDAAVEVPGGRGVQLGSDLMVEDDDKVGSPASLTSSTESLTGIPAIPLLPALRAVVDPERLGEVAVTDDVNDDAPRRGSVADSFWLLSESNEIFLSSPLPSLVAVATGDSVGIACRCCCCCRDDPSLGLEDDEDDGR